MRNNEPIGVFDSGLGGLTVLKELVKILPHEDFIYFADTAHLPYGEKSKSFLIERTLWIQNFFAEKNVKLIVAACHTASANALESVREHSTIPFLGIVEAAIETLSHLTNTKKIALLATVATVKSGVYQSLLQEKIPSAKIISIACPHFVPIIEQEKLTDPDSKELIMATVKMLRDHQIDAVLLGSTHYPFLQAFLRKELGVNVKLIDPAHSFAVGIRNFLLNKGLSNPKKTAGSIQFFSSKDTDQFKQRALQHLQRQIPT